MWKKFKRNPLETLLKRAIRLQQKRFLILWNRGLGDIPLGLYALIVKIRADIPDAQITFATRQDLAPCFEMLEGVEILVMPDMVRGTPPSLVAVAPHFDCVIEKADPTRWVPWQLGTLTPKLKWDPKHDALAEKFNLPRGCIGLHVQSETAHHYGYVKDWPIERFAALIQAYPERTFVLFGMEAKVPFPFDNVVDLRGKTHLFEMIAVVKNCCSALIAPDSGVLSIIYYIDAPFDLNLISLWADPRQGVLRQNVDSPNPHLTHFPLIGNEEKVSNVALDAVKEVLSNVSDRLCPAKSGAGD